MLKDRDIIIISPQRWGGMWVSKHWIANELSKCNRVLFVGPPIWIGGMLRNPFELEPIKRLFTDHRGKVNNNLFLFSPVYLPGLFGIKETPEIIILTQLKKEIKRLRLRDIILLNFGTNHHLIGNIKEKTSIYYCVDPPFPEKGKEQDEELTCKKSDIIFAISETYYNILKHKVLNKDIYVVPHGYDFVRASRVLKNYSAEKPRELLTLPKPIIGYVGSIHDAYVDTNLIIKIATNRPNWSFVLIGPHKNNPIGPSMDRRNYLKLQAIPNIYLLGPRHHNELPTYVKYFDVGMILHNLKEFAESSKTKQRTPFKLLHYLSQGKPIVSPPLYELGPLTNLIYLAKTVNGFLSGIDKALGEQDTIKWERINYASQFSYENILTKICTYILYFEDSIKK
ncbi:MAG: hypothetical protein HON76_04225 [Candidatus Scalindua sp.]|jgi:hypothetical protein|nr:hypothetical protein [Candidatus Scalindua sp.]MBT6561717.1 hypothetical protein [Candidatus Scalindua sp.]MBT7211119.1 hypothetical protein [Candidatus Scalindua sp.]